MYKVVCDKPGRLRVRFGMRAFSANQGYGICDKLLKHDFVSNCISNHQNGSILVTYTPEYKVNVLASLSSVDLDYLPEADRSPDQSMAEINRYFAGRVFGILVRRAVKRFILTNAISNALTVVDAVKYIWAGLRSLVRLKINVDVLDASAISAGLLMRDFSGAGSTMFLLELSDALAEYTQQRARNILARTLAIKNNMVWKLEENGEEVTVDLDDVMVGDNIIIYTGNLIPVDGLVVEGEAMVNESAMTGEPLAVPKGPDKTVFAGTAVEEGRIVVNVTSLQQNTRIAGILNMISDNEQQKALSQSKMENLAEKIVPFNFALFFGALAISRNARIAATALMVDFSCGLKLATPIAVITAMRQAAQNDVLVKGGKFFEYFAEADTVVFDKTGTLTTATPTVVKVISACELDENEVLRIAACLEEHFPHSVANAIVNEAADRNLAHEELHTEIEYIVAHGIASNYDGKRTIIGSDHFVFEDEGVKWPKGTKKRINKEINGFSPIYLAQDGMLLGVVCIQDRPRQSALGTIRALRDHGIKHVVMITGDNIRTAAPIAEMLEIDECFAGVLPEGKSDIVEELSNMGRKIIMVGDGINDAPALAKAHVSVAMCDASDIAREVADVVLLSGKLDDLLYMRKLSERLIRRVHNNFNFVMTFNSGLLLAGFLGVPTTATAYMHNGSTLLLSGVNTTNVNVDNYEEEIIKAGDLDSTWSN